MKRTNISLTESQHKFIKKEAYELGCSLSVVIRGLITDYQLSSKRLIPLESQKEVTSAKVHFTKEQEDFNPAPKPKKK